MNIFETITAVMGEIGAVAKNDKNPQQGFKYRGIDAVMNALAPALQKYKLFTVPEVLEQSREERTSSKGGLLIYSICKIKYTFYAEDGTFVSAVVIGEGMDSSDKATNKAMSAAFKYACFQTFCIPTEEMVDPDSECHDVKPKAKKEDKKTAAVPDLDGEPSAKISSKEIAELIMSMETNGVYFETIRDLYKVRTIEDLTYKQYDNIRTNWGKIIERQKNKVAQGN